MRIVSRIAFKRRAASAVAHHRWTNPSIKIDHKTKTAPGAVGNIQKIIGAENIKKIK
jgi:hypothetical protein